MLRMSIGQSSCDAGLSKIQVHSKHSIMGQASCTLLTPVLCQDFSNEALEQGMYLCCLQQQ